VGSTEPHGPHLPLNTDVIISQGACERAVNILKEKNITAIIAPAVAYGVTDFAEGFKGAVTIPAQVLTDLLQAIARSLLEQGFHHVCLVNNHLEPAHDQAVRRAAEGLGHTVSVATPLTRRWARTLSAEYKSGACHAGQYETSMVLAQAPYLVHEDIAHELPELTVSLSKAIANNINHFKDMGMTLAYTGSPSKASQAEGEQSLTSLAVMVATEVEEHLMFGNQHE
jgi:creatinine amidohydrolase